ncbi:MAG TPA: cytochrome b/b6 domain-containing protein [Ferrovaceae bacterium]|uniref:cytochrome b n=1 Tax=Ferrovum sp. JA12 TaxID=1356299 RepID=UPI00128EA5D1|nr:cytochrome b/b6 domain-containing protein [Ferrovum sp. JA12]HQT82187.1 cytochrome b/b6 domain-containing protein [Ferrovaceae bacterium]HQU07205.1 cytochrome b/b6 domain-containing protein [Ferrovaceae bacterium]
MSSKKTLYKQQFLFNNFTMRQVSLHYTLIARLMHWLVAVLLLLNGLLALTDDWWPERNLRSVIDFHKSLGIIVLFLVLMRILWRLTHQPPPLPQHLQIWELRLASFGHALLYLLIVAVPFSGWLHDSAWKGASSHPMTLFGLVSWPRIGVIMNLEPGTKEYLHQLFGTVHTGLNYTLYAVLAIHIIAVYKHEKLDKVSVLSRMSLRQR